MLTHITINNFTLVEHLDLSIQTGMTAITGETGTGKSILLDALSMSLGERADADKVRRGAARADITATFSLHDLPSAQQWLEKHELALEDECLLRRTIGAEGRSRSFINGQPATLQQVRALGEHLIDIHSQHAHQSLLLKATHQRLLDEYAQHLPLVNTVSQLYQEWQKKKKEFITLRDNANEVRERHQLLSYQVKELEQLSLEEGELTSLEHEQKQLGNADSILHSSQQLADICSNDNDGLQNQIQHAIRILTDMETKSTSLSNAEELLTNALIYTEEAHHEIRHQLDSAQPNPARLTEVNERLSACYEIARKHHIRAEELASKHQDLQKELDSLAGGDERLAELDVLSQEAEHAFFHKAQTLDKQRIAAAKRLTKQVNIQLKTLAMGAADFTIDLTSCSNTPTHTGINQIEFLISTNSGNPHKPLAKIASGGELSRISLAIQVATAQTSHVATLVFDEVDVGIGGATADVVGKLLAGLGKNSQVLCVTHLAQVASKAQQHWQVQKYTTNKVTASTISSLESKNKVKEIARMLSGDGVSDESIAHAQLILDKAKQQG